MNENRWRSFVVIIATFAVAIGSGALIIVHNCEWDNNRSLQVARGFLTYFHVITGTVAYILVTILLLISLARRIQRYSVGKEPFLKTFSKLLYSHLFIFIPPIVYGSSQIPYKIVVQKKIRSSHTFNVEFQQENIYNQSLIGNINWCTSCYHVVTLYLSIESLYD